MKLIELFFIHLSEYKILKTKLEIQIIELNKKYNNKKSGNFIYFIIIGILLGSFIQAISFLIYYNI